MPELKIILEMTLKSRLYYFHVVNENNEEKVPEQGHRLEIGRAKM
jgi:hypothetical protein